MYGVNEVHHPFGVWKKSEALGKDGEKLFLKLKEERGGTCVAHFESHNVTDRDTILFNRGYRWVLTWSQGCDWQDDGSPGSGLSSGMPKYRGKFNIHHKTAFLVEYLAKSQAPLDWIHGTEANPFWFPKMGYYMEDLFMPRYGHSVIYDSTPERHWIWTDWWPSKPACVNGMFKNDELCKEHFHRGCNMPWGFCRTSFNDSRIKTYLRQQLANGNLTYAPPKSPLVPWKIP
jgi:hypothetical protein